MATAQVTTDQRIIYGEDGREREFVSIGATGVGLAFLALLIAFFFVIFYFAFRGPAYQNGFPRKVIVLNNPVQGNTQNVPINPVGKEIYSVQPGFNVPVVVLQPNVNLKNYAGYYFIIDNSENNLPLIITTASAAPVIFQPGGTTSITIGPQKSMRFYWVNHNNLRYMFLR